MGNGRFSVGRWLLPRGRRRWPRALALVGAPLFVIGLIFVRPTDWLRAPRGDHPSVIAHRSGSALWPQNSRAAVVAAVAAKRAGIEMDIVLTRDGVPVLSHEPWVHTRLCRRADGSAVSGRPLIKDLTLAEVRAQYICGGVRDDDFPDAKPVAETIATLDEVLEELEASPATALYLDVKIDGEMTASPRAYADAIFQRWRARGLPNPLFVEGPDAASLAAYRASAGALPFTAVLSYPPFSAVENATLTAVAQRWRVAVDAGDPLTRARAAGANAVVAPTPVLTWRSAELLREAGLGVILFTPNTRADLDRACGWPATVLITDHPELGGCP